MNSVFQGWSSFKLLLLIMVGTAVISCENQEIEIPGDLMPEQQFVEAYAEVQLLEASIKQKLLRGRDSDEEIDRYYREIFEDKGLSRASFDETKAWYAQHPELLQAVVEQAMEVISRKQAGLDDSEESE